MNRLDLDQNVSHYLALLLMIVLGFALILYAAKTGGKVLDNAKGSKAFDMNRTLEGGHSVPAPVDRNSGQK